MWLIALIVFFTAGKRVYVGGYLTAQTIGEGANEPALVKLATSARRSHWPTRAPSWMPSVPDCRA